MKQLLTCAMISVLLFTLNIPCSIAQGKTPWVYPNPNPIEAPIVILGAWGLVATSMTGVSVHDWDHNSFDNVGRDLFRASDPNARHTARIVSDVLFYSSLGVPVLDVALFTGRMGDDVGWNVALMDLEAMLGTGLISVSTQHLSGRERPYMDQCRTESDRAKNKTDCDGSPEQEHQSFVSGHTAMAFTSAGLTCAHHVHLKPYGTIADAIACGGMIAIASTEGTLRIVSDRHWTTDVLAGAVTGFSIGYLLPQFKAYGRPAKLAPKVSGDFVGATVTVKY